MLKKIYKILVSEDVEKFIEKQDEKIVAKILRTLDLLEKFGHNLTMPHSKKIQKNLFELRIRGRIEIRIFYTFRRDIILIHAFVKKSQKIPNKELLLVLKKLGDLDSI
ncbi:MAG: hypothetical protein ACD_26C00141G0001 [uncultured bacterium]|nr:MAG: hypothetical protein ACD_26C00141G0001 [uncultured bacterium]